jgi:hypothetical protein
MYLHKSLARILKNPGLIFPLRKIGLTLLYSLAGLVLCPTAADAAQKRTEQVIRVWKVGSPHRGDVPDVRIPADLSRKAMELNCRIEVRSMPARDLYGLLTHAVATNDEPDILVIDNMGLIIGINTQLGRFDGIGRDPQLRMSLIDVSEAFRSLATTPGWQFLLKSSRNFAKAKLLAMMEPECDPSYGNTGPWTGEIKTNVGKTAKIAAAAYFQHDQSTLDALGDNRVDSEPFRNPSSAISKVKVCSGWGNHRLAFVNTVTRFENDQRLGYATLLAVLTNTQGDWKLLSLSTYPTLIRNLQQQPFVLNTAGDSESQLEPPALIAPADGASFRRWPMEERPLLEWSRAGIGSTLYLVEAQFTNTPRAGQTKTLWAGRGFNLVSPFDAGAVTIRSRAAFGAGQQPHRWRIWAIDENGFTVRSDWRVVNYIN